MRMQKFALTFILCLSSLQARAAFDENARRYLSAQEIIQSLQIFFDVDGDCKSVSSSNSSMLGVNSPVTGNPIAPSPTQSTVQWVAACVSMATLRFVSPEQFPAAFEKVKILFGPEAIAALSAPIPGGSNLTTSQNFQVRMTSNWSALNSDIRTKIIANMVFAMLGSDEVINDFGLIDPNTMRSKLATYADGKPDLTTNEMVKFLSVNLSVRDEFLSY